MAFRWRFLGCCLCSSSVLSLLLLGMLCHMGLTGLHSRNFRWQFYLMQKSDYLSESFKSREDIYLSVVSYLCVSIAWESFLLISSFVTSWILTLFYLSFHVLTEQINKTSDDKFGFSCNSLLSDVYFSLMEYLISSFKSV